MHALTLVNDRSIRHNMRMTHSDACHSLSHTARHDSHDGRHGRGKGPGLAVRELLTTVLPSLLPLRTLYRALCGGPGDTAVTAPCTAREPP